MRPATGVLLCAVALLVPACGGDDPPAGDGDSISVGEWAAAVCGALRPAVGDLEEGLATIDALPAEVDPDAPLGDRIDDLQAAFAALPAWTRVYQDAIDDTPAPGIPDGPAFKAEVQADLRRAQRTFTQTAAFVAQFGPDTTATQFFGRAQTFAGFSDALAAVDVDYGEDVPPDVLDATTADADCRYVSDHLAAALG